MAAAAPRATRKQWLGLAVLALPTMLIAMDLTVLHLALPTLTADLRPSNTELLWIVDVYGFLIAGFLIPMGAIGDRIGRRRLLLIGAVAFGAASVLSAFATGAPMLIAGRALLGVAGSTLMPSTLSLLRVMFQDPRQRGAAIGAWTGFFGLGTVIGPLLGGVFLEFFWWGSVFLIGVPIMLLLVVVGPLVLPEYRDSTVARPDSISVAMSVVGVLALVLGLKWIAAGGLGGGSGTAIALGLVLAVLFVHRQGRLTHPLVDLGLFRDGAVGVGLAMLVLATLLLAGSQFLVMQYLQLVRGLSPIQAGLASLPIMVGITIGAMGGPALVGRLALRTVLAAGWVVAAVGMVLVSRVSGAPDLVLAVAGTAVVGLGLGPTISMGTGVIVGAAPPQRAGSASALASTSTELGSALGIAVLGSVAFAVYRTGLAGGLPASVGATAGETLAAAVDVAGTLPPAESTRLLSAARAAFVHGLVTTGLIGAAIAALSAVAVAFLLRAPRTPDAPPATGVDNSERSLAEAED
ncbi:MFS transporter [Actinokineospora cianjurensis]